MRFLILPLLVLSSCADFRTEYDLAGGKTVYWKDGKREHFPARDALPATADDAREVAQTLCLQMPDPSQPYACTAP